MYMENMVFKYWQLILYKTVGQMKHNCRQMLPIVHHLVSPKKAKVVGSEVELAQTLTVALSLTHLVITSASVVICKMGIIIGSAS